MNSPEYNKVLNNISKIVTALKLSEATGSLTTQFHQKKWLAPTEHPTEDKLVNIALGRIMLDPSSLTTFIEMLKATPGLSGIVALLEGCKQESTCVVYMYIGLE